MKFYLSSFKIGNGVEKLKTLIGNKRRVAYVINAVDYLSFNDNREAIEETGKYFIEQLQMDLEILDLREYFVKNDLLRKKLAEHDFIWVRGGNAFILRRAMALSGFDKLFTELKNDNKKLYGGYSAGACVLSSSLRGLELVDDAIANPYGHESETIWEGLGILDFVFIPHYRSNHPESEKINKVVDYCIQHGLPFKTFHDGEVLVLS